MEQEVLNGHDAEVVVPDEDQNGVASEVSRPAGAEGTNNSDSVSVEHRIKRKAKRLIKQLSKEVVTNGASAVPGTRLLKNSRRPRNGFGRGLPKKGRCKCVTVLRVCKWMKVNDQNVQAEAIRFLMYHVSVAAVHHRTHNIPPSVPILSQSPKDPF